MLKPGVHFRIGPQPLVLKGGLPSVSATSENLQPQLGVYHFQNVVKIGLMRVLASRLPEEAQDTVELEIPVPGLVSAEGGNAM